MRITLKIRIKGQNCKSGSGVRIEDQDRLKIWKWNYDEDMDQDQGSKSRIANFLYLSCMKKIENRIDIKGSMKLVYRVIPWYTNMEYVQCKEHRVHTHATMTSTTMST